MRDRPILFSAAMVRAILDDRKTQTRRALKAQPPHPVQQDCETGEFGYLWYSLDSRHDPTIEHWNPIRCPYGVPGDRLYVRETWQLHERFTDVCRVAYAASARGSWTEMHADFPADLAGNLVARPFQEGWRPSIHMPRWASRITLEITEIRVERLQAISREDAAAEGVECETADPPFYYVPGIWPHSITAVGVEEPENGVPHAVQSYAKLWDHINGSGSWDANPFVWAVSFRRIAQEARAA